jgi:hypothetical protein
MPAGPSGAAATSAPALLLLLLLLQGLAVKPKKGDATIFWSIRPGAHVVIPVLHAVSAFVKAAKPAGGCLTRLQLQCMRQVVTPAPVKSAGANSCRTLPHSSCQFVHG